MCRYGLAAYKVHYGCFACRKVFRRENGLDQMKRDGVYQRYRKLAGKLGASGEAEVKPKIAELERQYFHRRQICPDCAGTMADLGMDFKAPKRSDEKQWKLIEGMYRMGHVFQTCGCYGPGFVPSNTAEYRVYLEERLAEYEESLRQAQGMSPDADAKGGELQYWGQRVERLRAEMAK